MARQSAIGSVTLALERRERVASERRAGVKRGGLQSWLAARGGDRPTTERQERQIMVSFSIPPVRWTFNTLARTDSKKTSSSACTAPELRGLCSRRFCLSIVPDHRAGRQAGRQESVDEAGPSKGIVPSDTRPILSSSQVISRKRAPIAWAASASPCRAGASI